MKSRSSFTISALAIAMLSGAGFAATPASAAQVRASLSTREAYVGSPITLSVEIENADSSVVPQIPQVDGLEIKSMGSPSRSSQTTIINGRRSHRVSETHAWRIVPRRTGTFEIPSIDVNVGGQTVSTRPQRFVVTRSETGDLLFAEIVGHDDKIYVGQPMNLTLKIWVKPYYDRSLDIKLGEGDMWQMISADRSQWGVFSERMQELAENNQRPGGEEVLRADADGNEHSYYQYEIPATIYPKRPGEVDAEDVQIVVDYPTRLGKSRDPFDSFFGGRSSMFGGDMPSMFGPKLVVADARPIVATASVNATLVSDVPTENRPDDYRGTVGQYRIGTQATPTDVQAGDPITLYIGISGDGPMELVQAPSLSVLSSDFRVSDDPLAGIVQDDTKLFTVSIRPRKAGITEIPAIPLTFFDPNREEFVTVKSEPIKINVTPGNNLAASAIVGRQGNGSQPAADPQQPQSFVSYANFTGDNVLAVSRPMGDWPWTIAFVFPPLLFVGTVLYRNREHLGHWMTVLPGSNQRATNAMLDRAKSPGEVIEALRSHLASCLNQPSSTMSPRDMIIELRSRGFSGLDQCEQTIEQCERCSYAASGGVDIAGLIQTAKSSVAGIGSAPNYSNTTMNSRLQGTQI